jgi:hypothetical protein
MLDLDRADILAAMFQADRDDPGFFDQFPLYGDTDDAIGGPPWWPPVSEVWQRQGQPHPYDDPDRVAEVWRRLQELYASWLAAQR